MNLDSVQDSTRYVVSGVHHGSILPGERMEMGRQVYLVDNADVRGGIWAADLEVSGTNIHVAESVFSKGSMTVSGESARGKTRKNQQPVEFASCVVVSDSLVVQAMPCRTRFRSDIFARNLNMENAIILGNIFAENAVLKNCIVLGGVFCRNRIDLTNTMISTFRGKEVNLNESVYLFFPFAVSEKPMNLKAPVQALTFFNIYQGLKTESNDQSAIKGGVVHLDQEDIYEVDDPVEINSGTDGADEDSEESPETEEQRKVFVLSGSERILDTNEIGRNFQFNRRFLEILALGSHMQPDARESLYSGPVEELENHLWQIIDSEKELESVSGEIGLEELFERADVLAALDQTRRKESRTGASVEEAEAEAIQSMEEGEPPVSNTRDEDGEDDKDQEVDSQEVTLAVDIEDAAQEDSVVERIAEVDADIDENRNDTDDAPVAADPGQPEETNAVDLDNENELESTETEMGVDMDWVEVPAGEYMMGDDGGQEDQRPAHLVRLDRFRMAKVPVTFEQFDRFCAATGHAEPDDAGWGREQNPVFNVSWEDARDFCEWLSAQTGQIVRLPTEAEWEYAARWDSGSKQYPFSGSNHIEDVAWYKENADARIHHVGGKEPNDLGIHDMSGGVWEWCADWYDKNYYAQSPEHNPTGPESGTNRVHRGGSWLDPAEYCRSTYRSSFPPPYCTNFIGFRPVMEP